MNGGEGNDKFERFVGGADPELTIEGGAGNDKVSGGAGFSDVQIDVGDGDDIVYGFDDATNANTQDVDLGYGDDVFFGGNGGNVLEVYGNYGNDKIFGPNDVFETSFYGTVTLNGDAGDDIIDFGDYNDIH